MTTNLKYFGLLQQIESNPLRPKVAAAVDIVDDFKRDAERLAANKNFSPVGRQNELQKHLRKALRDLRDTKKAALDEFHNRTETLRAAVTRPPYDKTDIVGAMLRKELRDLARTMTLGQREMHMSGPHRDPNFIDALLELEPWCSGVDIFNPSERALF